MTKKLYSIIFFILTVSSLNYSQDSWERIASPTENFLRTLYFADSLRGWVAGDSGAVFYTSDGGQSWIQQQTNTNNKIMRLFFLDDNRAWALAWADFLSSDRSFYGTEILKTTDGGINWSVEQYRDDGAFLRGIYFLDTLRGFMGGVPGKFLITTDGGTNWEPANIDSGTFSHFPVIDFKFYDDQYGFACGGRFDIAGVVWKTTNAGDSWAPIDAEYSPADEIWDIHFFDSSNVMGIGGDPDQFGVGIIKSSDAGESWEYFEVGVFGQALGLSFRTENEGWAVVPHSEVFVATFDYGETWQSYPVPDSSKLYDIIFSDSLTGYAVGEEGVIVKYKYKIPDVVENNNNLLIEKFELLPTYPNPFNPTTNINFKLSVPAQVKLNIYNALGIKVATLLDEYKSSGSYNLIWRAEKESSGVYYLRLEVDGRIKTQKMILLK